MEEDARPEAPAAPPADDAPPAGGDAGWGAPPKAEEPPQPAAPNGATADPGPAGVAMDADGGIVGLQGQRISAAEIQLVQNLVERCLQLYMNQREVVAILQQQAKIEPDFTALVWQKLEEQNAEFFSAYYTRLRLKDQILAFNSLLEQHALLSQKLAASGGGGGGGGTAAAAGYRAAAAAGGAPAPPRGGKLSDSGLFLDRSGAFHAEGDYLIDVPPHQSLHGAGGSGGGAGGGAARAQAAELQQHGGTGGGVLHAAAGEDAGAGAGFGHLPRNFSLSDLSVELTAHMAEGDVHMALLSTLNFPSGDTLGALGEGMGGGGRGGGGGGGEPGKLPHTFSLSDMTLFNEPRLPA